MAISTFSTDISTALWELSPLFSIVFCSKSTAHLIPFHIYAWYFSYVRNGKRFYQNVVSFLLVAFSYYLSNIIRHIFGDTINVCRSDSRLTKCESMFVNRRTATLFRVHEINPHESHQDARWALRKNHFATNVNIKKTYPFPEIVSNLNLLFCARGVKLYYCLTMVFPTYHFFPDSAMHNRMIKFKDILCPPHHSSFRLTQNSNLW